MDLEDIHVMVNEAENAQEFLLHDAERYSRSVDYFNHTNDEGYCELDEGHAVSKEEVLEEARHVVRSIDYHEEMLEDLKNAREEIPATAEYRVVGDESLGGSYEERIDRLISRYNDLFDSVIEICARTQIDPNIPDPITLRSVDRMDSQGFDGADLDRLLGA